MCAAHVVLVREVKSEIVQDNSIKVRWARMIGLVLVKVFKSMFKSILAPPLMRMLNKPWWLNVIWSSCHHIQFKFRRRLKWKWRNLLIISDQTTSEHVPTNPANLIHCDLYTWQGTSNEYPQHISLWRNAKKKKYLCKSIPSLIWSCAVMSVHVGKIFYV